MEYTPRSLASAAKRALANGPVHPMLGRREVEGREEEYGGLRCIRPREETVTVRLLPSASRFTHKDFLWLVAAGAALLGKEG